MKSIRKEEKISYAEAVKRVEGNRNETGQNKPEGNGNNHADQNICLDKRRFLAFIAMVINCAVEIQSKSERITMILHAARKFLDVVDISGEDLDDTLREGFAPSTQAKMPE